MQTHSKYTSSITVCIKFFSPIKRKRYVSRTPPSHPWGSTLGQKKHLQMRKKTVSMKELSYFFLDWPEKYYKWSRPYNIFNKNNIRPWVQRSHTSTILARTDCPTKKDSDRSALGSSIALKRKRNKLQETKYANKHLTKKSHSKKKNPPCFLGRNQSTDQENGQSSHFQSSYKHNPVYEFIRSKCEFMNEFIH